MDRYHTHFRWEFDRVYKVSEAFMDRRGVGYSADVDDS